MSYRVDDTRSGNGDGLLQEQETVDVVMRVRRVNDAPVKELLGVLRNDNETGNGRRSSSAVGLNRLGRMDSVSPNSDFEFVRRLVWLDHYD